MTSPTLMYSTPTAQQFNKKAQQKTGNRGASYTTEIHFNSPYLFLVAVKTLVITTRQLNSMIDGITIEKEEIKLLQYAGDTTAVLSDINSAHTLFKLLGDFKKLSGSFRLRA